MTKDFPGEVWKTIEFDEVYSNEGYLQVSNYGRIRTFNKLSDGNIIGGSLINGYRIIRLKLYTPRPEAVQKKFDYMQQQVVKLSRKLKALKEADANSAEVAQTTEMLAAFKKNLSEQFKKDLKKRTVNYHSLIHRLVADYFLPKPRAGQTIVAHLNYEKLNNRASNLRWMTPEENYIHQQSSPYVIKEKSERTYRRKEKSAATKLTVTKVMLLKKLLNAGKPMKQLVRQFKVTDTQILRIKRGENWADVKAAD